MRRDAERAFDAYLVAAARLGERTALQRLAVRWQPKLLGHAYRLSGGDAELAADATQDAWVEIVRSISRLDDADAFPAWALRIVGRRCARVIRSRQRRRRARAGLAREPGPTATRGAESRADTEQNALQAAMAGLSGAHRAVIGLFYLEDMSIAEIAAALEVPPGTVKTRLLHARRKLRSQLQGDDDETTG